MTPEGDAADTATARQDRKSHKEIPASDNPELASLLQRHTAAGSLVKPEAKSSKSADEAGETKAVSSNRPLQRSQDDPGLASRIQVVDQRKLPPKAQAKPDEAPAAQQVSDRGSAGAAPPKREEASVGRELFVDLQHQEGLRSEGRPREATATATGQNFSAILADRLRDSGNTEIVQSARLILKDGDSGTIRMRLNPPELGHVKIELHLADNSISGRIVVESDAARSAFEKGMADLHDAFRSGGFESAKLEVQVGSGDARQGGWNHGGGGGEGSPAPFWSERSRSTAFEPSSSGMSGRQSRASRAVDIVV